MHVFFFTVLLRQKSRFFLSGQTPLHLAASFGNAKETLQLLLMNPNLKPDLKSDTNETAFDIAQRSGNCYGLFQILDDCINKIDSS